MPETFRFADLRLDTGRRMVERDHELVELPKLSYRLLVALVRAAPNVLTPEEATEQVWKGRYVSPETITQRIKLLRDALGDDAANPRYVRAVRGQGYRIIPPVERAAPDSPSNPPRGRRAVSVTGIVMFTALLLAVALLYLALREPTDPALETDPLSIAVLPFDNLSVDADHAFFATAIHNDLLTYLAKIRSLKVISRTSVLGYEPGAKPLPTIGDELGVNAILEGSVQRAGGSVRVNVQLIDARTDLHLWAEIYEDTLTVESLFSIQTHIATSIAQALEAVLVPADVARLNAMPTHSTQAYELYLSGNDYFHRPDDRAFMHLAVQQYERATAADPTFALAWAALSRAHSLMYWYSIDATSSRLEQALEAAERAFALNPDLPEAHLALAQYHYQGPRDYDAALAEFALAEAGLTGTSELFFARAMILRRLGRWEEAVDDLDRALGLDPRNVDLLVRRADTYLSFREYGEAERSITRALDIEPDNAFALMWKVFIPLFRDGDVAAAKAVAAEPPVDLGRWREFVGWRAALYERDYDTALSYLDQWEIDVFAQQMYYIPKESFYAVTYALAERDQPAARAFRAARTHLNAALVTSPDDPRRLLSLAEALGGLGEREEAIALARRALQLLPPTEDAMTGPVLQVEAIIRVFAPLADADTALAELDAFLSAKAGPWSIRGLLPDPRLDPIREDTRLAALVARHDSR